MTPNNTKAIFLKHVLGFQEHMVRVGKLNAVNPREKNHFEVK